jgi:hypothetical protein
MREPYRCLFNTLLLNLLAVDLKMLLIFSQYKPYSDTLQKHLNKHNKQKVNCKLWTDEYMKTSSENLQLSDQNSSWKTLKLHRRSPTNFVNAEYQRCMKSAQTQHFMACFQCKPMEVWFKTLHFGPVHNLSKCQNVTHLVLLLQLNLTVAGSMSLSNDVFYFTSQSFFCRF